MMEFVDVFFVFASYMSVVITASILQMFDDEDETGEIEMEILV